MEWYIDVWLKYAELDGRARRQEYWMFLLINIGISVVLSIFSGILGMLYSLAVFVPSITVGVRRLHDTGRSGWWLLIGLIPAIGTLIVLVLMALEGDMGRNEYGADPKQHAD